MRKPPPHRAASTATAMAQSIPPVLRPLLRAYALGYASSTVPRLLTLILTQLRGRKDKLDADDPKSSAKPRNAFVPALLRILRGGLELQRFPAFCAALVGSATLLEIPLGSLLKRLASRLSASAQLSYVFVSLPLCAFFIMHHVSRVAFQFGLKEGFPISQFSSPIFYPI